MQIARELEVDDKTIGARFHELVDEHGKHPLVAVGIGVVVGFLIARALRR
jgi:hypothetical protein